MTELPWYRRTHRWAQTNLAEIDPGRYDEAWWRARWSETHVQGVIVNAGGIVAYYPSRFPLHHRARGVETRDLYGEVVASARTAGLSVVARMDSNRVDGDFLAAEPGWITRDITGEPYRAGDKFITCINSPYYTQYLPDVMREIIERSHPDGFADNSWAGLRQPSICYCGYCAEAFGAATSRELPRVADWDDADFRAWVRWSYQRRVELWDFNNRVTTEAGGADCLWFGMVGGDMLSNSVRFVDLKRILERSELIMLDHQRRNEVDGFEQNTEAGRRLHGLLGWDKLIPESTPQYQLGKPPFRLSAMPEAEVRLWSSAGFAGGIQPWWHHIGSVHEDRRQYATAEPLFRWHRDNQDVLFGRQPVADAGIVWSQENNDLGGQWSGAVRTLAPYRGIVRSLSKEGLTFLPLHADDIRSSIGQLRALVLPNMLVLTDEQIAAVEAFAAAGGGVIATGATSACDGQGQPREDLALGDLFALELTGTQYGSQESADESMESHLRHSYLRLAPELRAAYDGPFDVTAPVPEGQRHPVLAGLDETDILAFGGHLVVPRVRAGAVGAQILATYIPAFPIVPPELSWMRVPRTDEAAIVVRELESGARLVWMAADLDRCYARDEQPDHARIIANAVRWAIGGVPIVEVRAGGTVACTPYRSGDRLIVHLTNRVTMTRTPGRESDIVPTRPVTLAIAWGDEKAPDSVQLRVQGGTAPATFADGLLTIALPSVEDHEVVVIDGGD